MFSSGNSCFSCRCVEHAAARRWALSRFSFSSSISITIGIGPMLFRSSLSPVNTSRDRHRIMRSFGLPACLAVKGFCFGKAYDLDIALRKIFDPVCCSLLNHIEFHIFSSGHAQSKSQSSSQVIGFSNQYTSILICEYVFSKVFIS